MSRTEGQEANGEKKSNSTLPESDSKNRVTSVTTTVIPIYETDNYRHLHRHLDG